jgi:hypothetical protein
MSGDATDGLIAAIEEFQSALPGWWFTLGDCSVSADASCGPDPNGPDAHLLSNRLFDNGFHIDLPQPARIADALQCVTAQAMAARSDKTGTGLAEGNSPARDSECAPSVPSS